MYAQSSQLSLKSLKTDRQSHTLHSQEEFVEVRRNRVVGEEEKEEVEEVVVEEEKVEVERQF